MDYMHVKPRTPNLMKTTCIFGLSSIGCRRVIKYSNTQKNNWLKTLTSLAKCNNSKKLIFHQYLVDKIVTFLGIYKHVHGEWRVHENLNVGNFIASCLKQESSVVQVKNH